MPAAILVPIALTPVKFNFQKLLPHVLAVAAFVVIAGIYASPVWQGKRLAQHDSVQAKAAAHEVNEYHDATGEWSAWTNSMFGGMPAYLIATDYPTSLSTKAGQLLGSLLPEPVNLLVLMMLGGYLLLLVMGLNPWLAATGGIAYAFGSYNMLFIEAGHVSKMIALAYAPVVMAGVVLALKGRVWLGSALTGVFLGLHLYGNHVQVSYYIALIIGVYVVAEGISMIKAGKVAALAKALAMLSVAAAIAVGTHTTRLWTTLEYSKESNRGKSELTSSAQAAAKAANSDKEYAFSYSYGIGETLTLLIPNAYGGMSQGGLSANSDLYKTMTNQGLDAAAVKQFVEKIVPAYWGELPVASGPAYAGAILCFLFVLSCFVLRGAVRWWLISTAVLCVFIAWGKNFEVFNYLMFDYFPYFNKFRAATMIFSVLQLLFAVAAVLTLREIIERPVSFADLKKPLLYSLGLTAGLALALALAPGVFLDFRSSTDIQYLGQIVGDEAFGTQLVGNLVTDRKALLRADALRSVVFILLMAGLIWAVVANKIKPRVFYPMVALLILVDLFTVDKRYLNSADFLSKTDVEQVLAPNQADQQILQDKSLSYRVFDFSSNSGPFSDARPSYFHKSIGGYHGAKMKRYQELIENHIAKNNVGVLNMLNVKYLIQPSKSGEPMAITNPDAMGNAWFVKSVKTVKNANEEIAALDRLEPQNVAYVDERFADQLKGLAIRYDSTNSISLSSYKPNALSYKANVKSPQLAVFSEIFYKGNQDWKAYLNGKEVPHMRANYVLRAMVLPAGEHTIEFKFDPVAVRNGHRIDLMASVLLLVFVGLAVWLDRKTTT